MTKFKKIKIVLLLFPLIIVSCNFTKTANSETKTTPTPSVEMNNKFTIVTTGQKSSYDIDGNLITNLSNKDSLYGQDGHYKKGAEFSYKNNNDGTISDFNTGLMWQEIPSPEGMPWVEAEAYCKKLNTGGYTDWRLPNVKELYSIMNFSEGWAYTDTNFFKLHSSEVDKSEQYWSNNAYLGTTEEGRYDAAFGVNFATGHIKAYPNGKGGRGNMPPPPRNSNMPTPPPNKSGRPMNPIAKYVRAVRGSVYGINNFVDNKNETISDLATGLMWAKFDSKKGLDWKDALAYAENANIAGHSDWRLPNVKELQSIVDYGYAIDAKDAAKNRAAINPLFECSQIKNEAGNTDFPYYWTSTSARFQKGKPFYYAWYVAFGRAVNPEGKDFHGAGAVRFDTKHKEGPAGEGGERYFNYVRLVRDIK